MAKKDKFTKTENSWIMYDWANSVYATIVMAAVYPIYFAAVAKGQGVDGSIWWGYGTSIATFTVAILAPILGAIADYKNMKKKFLTFFLVVGVVFTTFMAIFGTWQMMLIGYMLSYIGFAGSCLFYDSFLTDVTTPARMDRVSAAGYAMGYIGGSTIPFLVSIALIFLMPDNNPLAIKISIILTSVWWAVFSIPILRNVTQKHSLGDLPKNFLKTAFQNIGHTLADIFKRKGLFLFILAYFFYIDGVGTVIHMSTSYGSTIGLDTTGMILALLVTQLVAAPFAMLFARVSKKIGSIRMLTVAVGVYFIICIVGFYMGFSLEGPQAAAQAAYGKTMETVHAELGTELTELTNAGLDVLNKSSRVEEFAQVVDASGLTADEKDQVITAVTKSFNADETFANYDYALKRSNILFWCMAVLVGTCQGGIQALSRSFFGRLIPPEKSNEYFGFFDIFGKFAAVLGPFLYATVTSITNKPSLGILSLMVLFFIGGAILIINRKTIMSEERIEEEA